MSSGEVRRITDPSGREWTLRQVGQAPGPSTSPEPPAGRVPNTLATVVCASEGTGFPLDLGLRWRDLPDAELWAKIERARLQQRQLGTGHAGSGA